MIQGGDFVSHDGTGRLSIYGPSFEDENFNRHHNKAGLLSMANSGPSSNGCQFFVTCAACDWLDGKHVVFGQVLNQESMDIVRRIENSPVGPQGKPKMSIHVSQCGEL